MYILHIQLYVIKTLTLLLVMLLPQLLLFSCSSISSLWGARPAGQWWTHTSSPRTRWKLFLWSLHTWKQGRREIRQTPKRQPDKAEILENLEFSPYQYQLLILLMTYQVQSTSGGISFSKCDYYVLRMLSDQLHYIRSPLCDILHVTCEFGHLKLLGLFYLKLNICRRTDAYWDCILTAVVKVDNKTTVRLQALW